MPLFTNDCIVQAAQRLQDQIVRTPLLQSPMLSAKAGCHLWVKAESLQTTGSFKFRGALNKVLQLGERASAGLVAFSAGNHGQGVAAAARAAGYPAVIVMPETAPRIKMDNCRWWGAQVHTYNPHTEDRQVIAHRYVQERGMCLVPPFDDHDIMAGQGTCGLEIVAQLQEQAVVPDVLVLNCSGGGLASGVTEALKQAFPAVQVVVVEIEGFEKMARSLVAGVALGNPSVPVSIMDGIAGPVAGAMPLEVLRRHGVQAVSVSDAQSLHAMAWAFNALKLVIEPAGAASLAAILAGKIDVRGKQVVTVASGGNVDAAIFMQALDMMPHP
ncbi:threonine ammonia-lyase [Lampropedia aestuarii]|uniref:threonine ammonia-lyase n=1 Tax=Lampropedia aestuarii TaxID=2562762 RepID=UPI00246867A6|nr:threonine/serine dehydratase [Lampropedia aestuarii]MDH5857927.1 threonine/serine dehydratase [Lampropedia aestuarii]